MKQTMGMWVGTGGFVMMSLVAALSVQSATVTWNVTSGGTWDTTSDNWAGGSPVGTRYVEGDNAVFTGAVNQTILVQSGGVTPASLLFSNTANTITLAPATGATGFLNAGAGTFTKNGAGTIVVTQGVTTATATCHGNTTVNAGTLQMTPAISTVSTGGFGFGTITLAGGTFNVSPVTAANAYTCTNAISVTAASTVNGLSSTLTTLSGSVALGGDLTISTYSTTLTGPITASGANRRLTAATQGNNSQVISINGNVTGAGGALTIRNSNYQAGSLLLGGSYANFTNLTFLGDNTYGSTRVLGDNSGYTGAMRISSSAVTPFAVLPNYAHMVAFSNSAALGGTTSVVVDTMGIAGFEYPVDNATITGRFVFAAGGGVGAGGAGGTLTNVANLSARLSSGGNIYLDNNLAVNQNRWGDLEPVALDGGYFYFRGYNSSKSNIIETVGTLTFNAAGTVVIWGSSSNTIMASSIARAAGSKGMLMVDCDTTLGGQQRVMATAGVATSNGIVAPSMLRIGHSNSPWGLNDVNFMGYGATGFTNGTFTSTDLNSAGANDVVDATNATVTLGSSHVVYALRVAGSITNSAPGVTVTTRSGGLVLKGNSTQYANFTFGDSGQGEALVYTYGDNTLAGYLTASNLTKAGFANLTISSSNAIAGDYTIDQGTLTLKYAALQTSRSNNVSIGYGALLALYGGDINIGGLTGEPGSSAQGEYYQTRNLVINPPAGSTFTYNGMIRYYFATRAYSLGLVINGSGTQVLAGVNTYDQATVVSNGTLVIAASGALLATPSVTVYSNAAFYYNAAAYALTSSVLPKAGATVGGSGMLASALAITNGVHLAPGYGPGALSVSNLTLSGGALYDWEWGGKTNYDRVTVLNQLTLTAGTTNTIRLFAPVGGQPQAGSYPILTWNGSTPPSTSVTWLVSKPVGGGAEGWPTPTVRMDTTNKQILLVFPNMGTSIVFR